MNDKERKKWDASAKIAEQMMGKLPPPAIPALIAKLLKQKMGHKN